MIDESEVKDAAVKNSSVLSPRSKKSRPMAADFMESDSGDEFHSAQASPFGSTKSKSGTESDGDSKDKFQGESICQSKSNKQINIHAEISGSFDDENKHESFSDGMGTTEQEENTDESSEDSENEDSETEPESEGEQSFDGRAFNRGLQNTVSRLSAAAQKEAARGRAIRDQRKLFDSVLNLRVRMQKSLVASNSFELAKEDMPTQQAFEAAEVAALKLWNTIDSLRAKVHQEAFAKLNTPQKRKAEFSSSSEEIWENMLVIEKRAACLRKRNLEKWSEKANRGFIQPGRDGGKLTLKQTLTASLDGQLANPERLVKRTQIPRSCAPIQAREKKNEDSGIYDDADFYQLLLKELLDQRTSESSAGVGGNVATVIYTAQKEAKQRKVIDTKASKGRKMRFNVHEKLVNFMTREDRTSWESQAIDGFFGSLFGKKLELNEDVETESEGDEDAMVLEDSALRLFRN